LQNQDVREAMVLRFSLSLERTEKRKPYEDDHHRINRPPDPGLLVLRLESRQASWYGGVLFRLGLPFAKLDMRS